MRGNKKPRGGDQDVFEVDMVSCATEFDDFIYLISHDVRNSVRALIELPQWIEEDLLDAGIKPTGALGQTIALMNTHTGRLDRMLVDLLAYSRVGRMQQNQQIDIEAALSDILDEIRVPAGFRIDTDFTRTSLGIGDRDAQTLLTQLLSNALKHHDRGGGRVLVGLHEANGAVVLEVRDDGPGVPQQYRETVFAAMTTLRPRDQVEGSGMGLAIVRRIAQLYQGGIAIGPGLDGRGTTVSVRFPISSGSQVPASQFA